MTPFITTETIGSVPRPPSLIEAVAPSGDGRDPELGPLYDYAASPRSRLPLKATRDFAQARSGEKDPGYVPKINREPLQPSRCIFKGVFATINPKIKTPEDVRNRVLQLPEYMPVARLGTTDDYGYTPFRKDTLTARVSAFETIRTRVLVTSLAADILLDRSNGC